jgi:hypothetical protein
MQGLGIKIGNKWLKLRPGTVLEIERNNPHLQFGDEVLGDYSMPTDIDNDPYNEALIDYAGYIQKRNDGAGKDCRIYSNGFQHSIAKLKIEKPTHNLNRSADGTTSIYFLGGVANFYQDIKKFRLKDIDLGGVRTFAKDNFNIAGAGFWGHIHSVINALPGYGTSGYDYTFFPCINNDWDPNGYVDLVNCMTPTGPGGSFVFTKFVQKPGGFLGVVNPIIPFPYLKYVLEKAVAHAGWKLQGDILDDADFKKITLWNVRSIKWGYKKVSAGGLVDFKMYDSISFDLKDFLPDVSVAELLLAIKNRLGLSYDFDRVSKIIRIKKLSDVVITGVKDLTRYADPVVVKSVAAEKKTYALRDAEGAGEFNLSNPDYQGPVNKYSDLPAAAEALVEKFYLVTAENNFYICAQNESTAAWFWDKLSANLGGVGGNDAQETITSAAITIGSEKYDNDLQLVPRRDEAGIKDKVTAEDEAFFNSIVLLFNHGRQDNSKGKAYPFGSHHVYSPTGVKIGNWSLAYKAQLFDGTPVGLYDVQWKKVLNSITVAETFTVTLNLPWIEYLKLQFGDVINIANVNMYVTKIRERIPYEGSVEIEAVRS